MTPKSVTELKSLFESKIFDETEEVRKLLATRAVSEQEYREHLKRIASLRRQFNFLKKLEKTLKNSS